MNIDLSKFTYRQFPTKSGTGALMPLVLAFNPWEDDEEDPFCSQEKLLLAEQMLGFVSRLYGIAPWILEHQEEEAVAAFLRGEEKDPRRYAERLRNEAINRTYRPGISIERWTTTCGTKWNATLVGQKVTNGDGDILYMSNPITGGMAGAHPYTWEVTWFGVANLGLPVEEVHAPRAQFLREIIKELREGDASFLAEQFRKLAEEVYVLTSELPPSPAE